MINQTCPRDMKYHNKWPLIKSRFGHSNIFLSEKIQEEWQHPGYIIPPGIPKLKNDPNKQKEIAHIWCEHKQQKLLKNTIGPVDFIKNGDFSKCYLMVNTTTHFYPIHALIAMSAGCCVLFQEAPEIDFIEHEVNGLIYKDVNSLRPMLDHFKNNRDKCLEIGKKGQEIVQRLFPLPEFIKKFNVALKQTLEIPYVR
jgi:hypothetical protein